jgi:uncharacterized protein (DUF362 family)/Pyruvate/2-oxoacid:ferredoxin oxidoreductase delta subunit
MLAPLGGMEAFVAPGQRVLLKPNLLYPKPPAFAVTTHPAVVRAVAEAVLAAGGKVFLGDSPTVSSLEAVLEKSGIGAVMEELGIGKVPFRTPKEVEAAPGSVFTRLELSAEVLSFDRVINLPKLKTHGQMTLTLGVKNLFGCVVGMAKPAWHLRAGSDLHFADLLLDIARTIAPCLTVMDGITAMEGNGPGSGTPRDLGLLAASPVPLALDFALAELLGVDEGKVPFLLRARERGLAPRDIIYPRLSPAAARVEGFRLPPTAGSLQWAIPGFIRRPLRRSLSTYPVIDRGKCDLCERCREVCPAGAMLRGADKMLVDRRRCIGCFCCQELCPAAALTPVPGRLLALFKKLGMA